MHWYCESKGRQRQLQAAAVGVGGAQSALLLAAGPDHFSATQEIQCKAANVRKRVRAVVTGSQSQVSFGAGLC